DDKEVIKTVTKIINELLENKDIVVQLTDIRARGDYHFAHSVNCTILAVLVATKKNYDYNALRYLATGTLLHDLGMTAIPESILNKPAELTEDERKTIQTHPSYGFEIFKKTRLFDARAGIVILQHHERIQGQGYPGGLCGDRIHQSAQIVGIVDVYDALTSERPFRKAFPPYRAIEMLMSRGGEYFNLEILQHFFSVVAAYPFGSHVYLSNEDSGLVIANNPGLTLRPVVRVLYQGRDLAPHPSPYDLDLSQSLDLTITDVLD
ncbi:MAG: HD-GYP domain-containing protein, partial [Bacillota bacterium]